MKGALLAISVVALAAFCSPALAQSDGKMVLLRTSLGNMAIELFPDDAPEHAANFMALAESGFYDGVLFHRIIPNFMIQGGDPNTIDGDPSSWGTGGNGDSRIAAEFNDIKHERGIVSMARSAHPNSASSQFFIVHADSNFLDENYTVFGRLATQESFVTLDAIASVPTGARDAPLDPDGVRIMSATVVDRSEVGDALSSGPPERIVRIASPDAEAQLFENDALGFVIAVPAGWNIQEPSKFSANAPDLVIHKSGPYLVSPSVVVVVSDTGEKTADEIFAEQAERLAELVDTSGAVILVSEETVVNGHQAHRSIFESSVPFEGGVLDLKSQDLIIYGPERYYSITFLGMTDGYDSEISMFEAAMDSFEIVATRSVAPAETPRDAPIQDGVAQDESAPDGTEAGGGCLIATAAYGTELAPQVQQLRELRDNVVGSTGPGAAFLASFNQLYYSFSPAVADLERQNPMFREAVKLAITPLMHSLAVLNYAGNDSEAEIVAYGIVAILLTLGVYVGAPVALLYCLRIRLASTRHHPPHPTPCTPARPRASSS